MESLISERLASLDPTIRLPAFEAFGNLWRFTGKLFEFETMAMSM